MEPENPFSIERMPVLPWLIAGSNAQWYMSGMSPELRAEFCLMRREEQIFVILKMFYDREQELIWGRKGKPVVTPSTRNRHERRAMARRQR